MKVKVQVVTLTDDGEESMREVACVERAELTPTSLGLSIADSKAILDQREHPYRNLRLWITHNITKPRGT